MRALAAAIVLTLALAVEGFAAMKPRVIETKFPTDDVVIASLVIEAPKDGVGDATGAIQAAIDEAAAAGGAVVFLPAGRYRLAGRLTLKEGVTLRGDRSTKETAKSTMLMPTADKGNADAPPAITMERGTGLCNLAIWYPDQDPMKIVPYPWSIRTSEKATGDNITIQNVALVNPYQAIKIGPEWNELHTIRYVHGTPLKAGIWIDTCTDIGRVTDVDFGPSCWEESGLAGSPATAEAKRTLGDFLRGEGVAYEMRRSDWEYFYGIHAHGYAVGLVARPGQQGTANAVLCSSSLGGGTALLLEGLNEIGLSVTGTSLYGSDYAVHAPASFNSTAQFRHG
ncbi:MAG TPA: glycosyl hydrolase family 28-related protein [Planctomycetota bacterium]|nr:glycosyl hydrolase family 28-related protein [Planctomycetota bacterium]